MKKWVKGLLMVIALFFLVVISYSTYAIYKSAAGGTAAAKTANWAIKVNGTDIVQETTFSLEDMEWENSTSTVQGDKIAPGSVGTLEIEIDATGSQVPVDYDISIGTITVDSKEFTNSNFTIELVDSESTLTNHNQTATGTIAYSKEENAMKKTVTLKVTWNKVDSETANEEDITLATKSMNIPVTVVTLQHVTTE